MWYLSNEEKTQEKQDLNGQIFFCFISSPTDISIVMWPPLWAVTSESEVISVSCGLLTLTFSSAHVRKPHLKMPVMSPDMKTSEDLGDVCV